LKVKALVPEYLRYLETLGRSPHTLRNVRYSLNHFICFLDAEGAAGIETLDEEIIAEYQQELCFCLTAGMRPLARRTQALHLFIVKGFTRFLKERDYLAIDPGKGLILPKKPRRLPRVILSVAEVRQLLAAADTRTKTGHRNRVILEILYDTAIRRAEAAGIRLHDLDLGSGYLRVIGKGDKERVVPLSRRVCALVETYITAVRPGYVRGSDPGYLILNRWGRRMNPNGIWAVVKRCAKLAGMEKTVSTHTLRHACATHMLKNGAPTRHLQQMLGHESLESTQLYTHVTINDLKEIHARYHPSGRL
jgi:integrase/recombinase XerD